MHSLDHQNLRRIDAFFRPVQADRCAWQNGCGGSLFNLCVLSKEFALTSDVYLPDEIQSALDAVTAQRGQASVVNAYLGMSGSLRCYPR